MYLSLYFIENEAAKVDHRLWFLARFEATQAAWLSAGGHGVLLHAWFGKDTSLYTNALF